MLCTTLEYHAFLTLPLWVLSAIFPYLLPLAIASLLLSVAVCVAAAAQAALPKNKTRRWSRPLTAMLFFLQPIVRGWARYQYRLALRPLPPAARQTLQSVTLRDSGQTLDQVQYWAEQRIDRLAFVAGLLRHLDRQGWPNRADIGWSDYDVEIYDTRWSKLQLTTVTRGTSRRQTTHPLPPAPTLVSQSQAQFLAALRPRIGPLGIRGLRQPWLWLLLLTPPAFCRVPSPRNSGTCKASWWSCSTSLPSDWKLSKVPQDPGPRARGLRRGPTGRVSVRRQGGRKARSRCGVPERSRQT